MSDYKYPYDVSSVSAFADDDYVDAFTESIRVPLSANMSRYGRNSKRRWWCIHNARQNSNCGKIPYAAAHAYKHHMESRTKTTVLSKFSFGKVAAIAAGIDCCCSGGKNVGSSRT
jgi:hypothetical protein